jgi:hypothetical protein
VSYQVVCLEVMVAQADPAALVDLVVLEAQADLAEEKHMHQLANLVDPAAQVVQEAQAVLEALVVPAAHLYLDMKMFQQVSYHQAFLAVLEDQADLEAPVALEDQADLQLKANHPNTDQLAHQVALEVQVDREALADLEVQVALVVLVSFIAMFIFSYTKSNFAF